MPKITKRLIDGLKPSDREYVVWDREVAGFGARIRPSGKISYLFKYRVGGGRAGRARKPTIGVHGTITSDQARAIARQWAGEVAAGGDPGGGRRDQRDIDTLSALCDRYLTHYAELRKKESSLQNDRRLIERKIKPAIGNLHVQTITRADITNLHHKMRETPYEANRTMALLSKMFNLSEKWDLRQDNTNPCRHVERYPEKKRERFLFPNEMAALGKALSEAEQAEKISKAAAAAIRLLLFSGCRRGEILTLKWEHVDLEKGCLRLPESKTGAKVVHLPAPAIELLANIDHEANNPFVIIGQRTGSHLKELKRPWSIVRERAGLDGVRIHDLRHTYASVAAGAGLSLPMIGRLLGHTVAETTKRYSHLEADPVKRAAETIGATIDAALRGKVGKAVELNDSRN